MEAAALLFVRNISCEQFHNFQKSTVFFLEIMIYYN